MTSQQTSGLISSQVTCYKGDELWISDREKPKLIFYFEIKGASTSAFLPCASVLLDAAVGGGLRWCEGGRVRRWECEGDWLAAWRSGAERSPAERPPASATACPRLEVLPSAAKRRSMAALNGLRPHWRSASMRARITMDAQRLQGVTGDLGG